MNAENLSQILNVLFSQVWSCQFWIFVFAIMLIAGSLNSNLVVKNNNNCKEDKEEE